MKCPKCKITNLKTINTYRCGDLATVRKLECPGCGCIVTAQTLVCAVDPTYGQGARAVANKLKSLSPGGEQAPSD